MVVGGAWLWQSMWLPGECVGYDEIRSMSRRYASYWNAFLYCNHSWSNSVADPGFPIWAGVLLFDRIFAENCMKMKEIGLRGGGRP